MKETREINVSEIEQLENTRDVHEVGELMRSIQQHGLLQSIGVRQTPNGYEVIYGNRRLEAVRKLGWNTVSANIEEVKNEEDMLTLNIVENIQRENPTVGEYARMFEKLMAQHGLGHTEIAARLNIPASRVRTICDAVRILPKGLLDKVKIKKTPADAGVSLRSINSLISVQRKSGMPKEDFKKLSDKVVSGHLSDDKIGLVGTILANSEVTPAEAMAIAEECVVRNIVVIMGKKDVVKIEKAYGDSVSNVILNHISEYFPVVTRQGRVSKGFKVRKGS